MCLHYRHIFLNFNISFHWAQTILLDKYVKSAARSPTKPYTKRLDKYVELVRPPPNKVILKCLIIKHRPLLIVYIYIHPLTKHYYKQSV